MYKCSFCYFFYAVVIYRHILSRIQRHISKRKIKINKTELTNMCIKLHRCVFIKVLNIYMQIFVLRFSIGVYISNQIKIFEHFKCI